MENNFMDKKNNFPAVAVLMSTYNGEKYILEQIRSILSQKEVDIFLFIRDDGSTDNTCAIIEAIQDQEPNRIFLERGDNLGFANSFMSLVYNCYGYHFYAFADQDDVWEENKLISAIHFLKADEPALYGSNLKAFDMVENRQFYIYDIDSADAIRKQLDKYVFISNPYGCTMVWNDYLQKLLHFHRKPDILTHDVWVNLVARCTGTVYFDLEHSYINYRIHGNNACGATPKSFLLRLKKYYRFYFIDNKSLNIGIVCKTIHNEFPEYEDKVIKAIANYDSSLKNKIKALKVITEMDVSKNSRIKYTLLLLFKKL